METNTCPGYTSPITGATYGAGEPHQLTTRNGVRCGACGVEEPHLRAS